MSVSWGHLRRTSIYDMASHAALLLELDNGDVLSRRLDLMVMLAVVISMRRRSAANLRKPDERAKSPCQACNQSCGRRRRGRRRGSRSREQPRLALPDDISCRAENIEVKISLQSPDLRSSVLGKVLTVVQAARSARWTPSVNFITAGSEK